MGPILLAVDPPPGVDPFVGWVIAGLVVAVVVLAGVVYRLAMRGVEREVALGVLATRSADVAENSTKAAERVSQLMERKATT